MNGILLIDKPLGWTSHDVTNKIRRVFHTKQVGHTGTLDPMATGVLIILIGDVCKLCNYFVQGMKEYEAWVEFGIKTSTYDLEKEIIAEEKTDYLTKEDLEKVLPDFMGDIKQVPPMSSAIKLDGQPLYKLDRQGIELSLSPRDIFIEKIIIEDTDYNNGHFRARLKIRCSQGTYIRALARDLGESLKTFATLTGLTRTENHNFRLEECTDFEEIISSPNPEKFMKEDNLLIDQFPFIDIENKDAKTLSFGQYVPYCKENTPLPVLAYCGDRLVSIGRIKDNFFKPKRVFVKPENLL
ncbi:MAG: tRNA pseudouridine(55) synthase TruB [Armatimonadetes bacterium]|nr:tRNA pseudouridine(55) synthase TruB [Candidatus Hippobium faecium]